MPIYAKRELPPCPGRSEDFTLVNFRDKYYWRLKRGKRKPAVLNHALQARADAMKALRVTIRELRHCLADFIQPLPSAYLHQRLFGLLQHRWVTHGTVDYRALEGMEMQPEWPLDKLFKATYHTRRKGQQLQLLIPATYDALQTCNRFVSEFVLEAMMVAGREEAMYSIGEASVLYDMPNGILADCVFEFELPLHEPWMLLLKVSCFEGASRATHLKHYAARVVEVG